MYRVGADCDNVPNHITDEDKEATDSDELQLDENAKTEEKDKTETVPDQSAPRVKRKPSWLRDYT